MTVFVDHLTEWKSGTEQVVENYVAWLIANVGPISRTESGKYDDWQTCKDIEEQKYAQDAWQQMQDNYWCLCEAVNYDMTICSLIMYYGTGWHVMNMCGIPAPYLYDDDVVVVIYDEVLALQFKLACR